MRDLLNKIILLVAVLLILFVLLEIGTRFSGAIKEDIPQQNLLEIYHAQHNPFLIFGPRINEEFPKDNSEVAHWNAQGFRLDYDLEKKEDVEYRIFALGGSTTENLGSNKNVHYAGEATKILNSKNLLNKEISVINSGKSAYSSAHSLIRLQFDILQFEPDIVTVMHNYNDLSVNFFPGDDQTGNYSNKYLHKHYARTLDSSSKSFLKSSDFLVFVVRSIKNIKDNMSAKTFETEGGRVKIVSNMRFTDQPIELKYTEAFKRNLRNIVQISKRSGAKVVLMSQPAVFDEDKIVLALGHKPYNKDIFYPKTPELKRIFEEYNKVIEEVAQEEGVHFIDMYNLFGHNSEDFIDMLHYSADGVRKFGEIYSRELESMVLSK